MDVNCGFQFEAIKDTFLFIDSSQKSVVWFGLAWNHVALWHVVTFIAGVIGIDSFETISIFYSNGMTFAFISLMIKNSSMELSIQYACSQHDV